MTRQQLRDATHWLRHAAAQASVRQANLAIARRDLRARIALRPRDGHGRWLSRRRAA